MATYCDASVILRYVLGQPGMEDFRTLHPAITSRLAQVECLRTLDRSLVLHQLTGEVYLYKRDALLRTLQSIEIVEIDRAILDRASEPAPVPIGTLDALHLATALKCREQGDGKMIVATHDRALASAARAYGFPVRGA